MKDNDIIRQNVRKLKQARKKLVRLQEKLSRVDLEDDARGNIGDDIMDLKIKISTLELKVDRLRRMGL